MQFGIHIPPFGPLSDVRLLAELATEAEQAGWDGFFLWDDVTFAPPIPVADPWIALTAIALHTRRIRLGPLVTPLPRRRPWKIARETITLDQISHGRLILGVGIGGSSEEFDNLGEEQNQKVRASMLEESLEILVGLWSGEPFHFEGNHYHLQAAQFLPRPVQLPRIPIWVAGGWPNKAPFRRAARWDGVFPEDQRIGAMETMKPQELQSLLNYIALYREQEAPFEVVLSGCTSGVNTTQEQALVASYAPIGVTWWLELFIPQRWGGNWSDWPLEQLSQRIKLGPTQLPSAKNQFE